MLFNSYEFIFLFLPLTLLVFYLIGAQGYHRIAIAWLVGTSLFFYSWWNPAYLGLMLFSIIFNYSIGVALGINHNSPHKKLILFLGVATNLGLLGYFKYANFFVENIGSLTSNNFNFNEIILPIAISFFTFQQIAYLVDTYRGETKEYNFLHYCLFVTFFPQLIAGPIVHHKEMLPQFAKDIAYRMQAKNFSIGLTIFAIGLFKKVVLADGISIYVTPVFDLAEAGAALTIFEAWGGALAYSFQLYYDFSGYSDMAIGLARMLGIRLPLNFNSPYKSTSIIDFWRRWHITLSRFLRDYVYFPLGGNRKGEFRRLTNILFTMLLGGLWHGAGWTFVLWGGLHGTFLVINHIWRNLFSSKKKSKLRLFLAWTLTMFAIVVSWVPFRAASMEGANNIIIAMFGGNGISLPARLMGNIGNLEQWLTEHGVTYTSVFYNGVFDMQGVVWVLALLLISVSLPNIQQIMINTNSDSEYFKDDISKLRYHWIKWKPSIAWVIFTAVVFLVSIINLSKMSEFLYFQF
jgi:alginate O-acetyltransferase complex protein AlgI